MKKLLHERLREHAKQGILSFTGNRYSMALYPYEAYALADEIERYYIPLSCDTDGNPWKIGDDCITAEGEEATIVGYRGKGRVFIDLHDERCYARSYASDLKRPSPKALDADGMEIKEWDTVWSIDSQCRIKVAEIDLGIGAVRGYSDNRYYCQYSFDNITHKEPDSLEKLRDDMRSFGEVGADCTSDCCLQYADRLTALIEREK